MRPLSSVLALVMVAACAPPPSGDATIAVRLADDAVVLQPEAVTTGRIVFDTTNTSAGLVHEIEVFAEAVAGEVLPVVDSVADTTGLRLIDEVEDIVPGGRATLTLDLAPGIYLVTCNLPGHYQLGMWTHLTVTPDS